MRPYHVAIHQTNTSEFVLRLVLRSLSNHCAYANMKVEQQNVAQKHVIWTHANMGKMHPNASKVECLICLLCADGMGGLVVSF